MKIPKGIGTFKQLKERESKAHSQSMQWWSTLEDVYEYFLPQRNLFNEQDTGNHKMDRIFDSTPLDAIQQAASKLQDNIAPIWSRWANFEPSREILDIVETQDVGISEEDLRESLEKQAEVVFDFINRSNFGTQFFEMALDLLVGTGTLMVTESESEEMPIIFNSMPQNSISFEEGPHGTVETHWRRFEVKARDIERKWKGFEPSTNISNIIKKNPDTKVKVREGLVFDPKENIYWGVVWVDGENKLSWVESFQDSSPWVTGRYAKVSGEIRGRGPAMQAYPDVRSLNKAKEFSLQKAAIDLSGIWTATDDGVTNPYNITIAPGMVMPVGSNNSQNPSLQRLDTNTNLQLGLFVIQDLQESIRRTLFSDLRSPSDAVVSATQFAMESRELAKRIGSAFGRLQTEVLIPILKRVVWILTRRGLINPININGTDVTVKFTSPLARSQDSEDLLAVQQAVEFTIRTAGPDAAKMAYKQEDFGTWAAVKTGMPQELVRNDVEKAQIIQAGAEAAQAGLAEKQPPLKAV